MILTVTASSVLCYIAMLCNCILQVRNVYLPRNNPQTNAREIAANKCANESIGRKWSLHQARIESEGSRQEVQKR